MRVIYKYPIRDKISLPAKHLITRVGIRDSVIYAWVELDTEDCADTEVEFLIVGTGQQIPEDSYWLYKATVFDGPYYVWHIYTKG